MKTLDSLSREDLLKTLKDTITVHTAIEGTKQAKQESQNRLADAQRKLKRTGIALRICGYINLICLILAVLPLDYSSYWVFIGVGISTAMIVLGWHMLRLAKSKLKKVIIAIATITVVWGGAAIMTLLFESLNVNDFIGIYPGGYYSRDGVIATKFFPLNAVLFVVVIAVIVYGFLRKIKYQKGEFAQITTEEQCLIDEYNQKIDKYNDILAGAYNAYCVRKDLQSAAALRFCYDEIYSSSKIDINEALQHYLEKKHRDRMAKLKQQQIEEIRRASQQAHDDAMAMQQAQANTASKSANAQEEANATLRRMENDQWFNRRG